MSVIQPGKDITLADAAEYINKSAFGKLAGRIIGPFRGMSDKEAEKAAIDVIKAHLQSSKGNIAPDVAYKIQKAVTKIHDLDIGLKAEAEKIVSAYKATKRVFSDAIDPHLLKALSKEIGIDLRNLEVVIQEKYPHHKQHLKDLVDAYQGKPVSDDTIVNPTRELVTLERALCRRGDFDLREKSRPEILASALRRTATSAVNLLVNVPLGAARLVASPFIALAGVATFATGKDGGKLLRLAVQEAGAGASDALNSVIGFVGTVIGAVVDPILGKERVREAQLYTRAALTYVGGAMPLTLAKYPEPQSVYNKVLNSVSRFQNVRVSLNGEQVMKGKKVSKWNPASDQTKANSFMKKMVITFMSTDFVISSSPSIQSAREKRQELRKPPEGTPQT